MFERIIVGVDGDEGGRDAIALAQNLLAPGGKLTLAHVFPGDPTLHRGADPYYEQARANAQDMLERVREETSTEAHVVWREATSVGRGLHELCEIIEADLLSVGSSRRGLLGRVLLGDDTLAALNGAPCAIAIAPAGYLNEPFAMREIGVGYNGSPESRQALHQARKLARDWSAKLSAFQVASLPAMAYGGITLGLGETIQGLVDEARSQVGALGDIEAHAAFGQPAEELALYSASLDLLIVGSRGYGPVGRVIHGSTSRQLARTARCPLLVLPRATRITETSDAAGDDRAAAVG